MIFYNSMNSEGTGSKRKALEMITNIFCKKTKEAENVGINKEPTLTNADNCSNGSSCQQSLSIPEVNVYSGNFDALPKSPISPRVKNIDKDMEALTLSRQDNPYIMQQMERLSVTNEYFTELSISTHSSPARSLQRISIQTELNNDQHITSDGTFIMDSEESYDHNLHDKLIRSPPPNFPQTLSLFVFPESSAGSVQSLSKTRYSDDSPLRSAMSPTFILSNHSKKGKFVDPKSRISRMSNDSTLDDMKTRQTHSRENQFLSASPRNCSKYERRGSDSLTVYPFWKSVDSSMAVSSSSLLSFVPQCSAISPCNETNVSFYECRANDEAKDNSQFQIDSLPVMDMYCNYDDNYDNQMSFISPSNSREALLKDCEISNTA